MTDVVVVPGLDALPFAAALRDGPVLMTIVKTAHLTGIALMVGCVIAFDLRVLGLNAHIAIQQLARHLLPPAVLSLTLILPSGVAMFAAHAGDLLNNRLFALKMALILLGAVLAVVFHTGPYRDAEQWDRDRRVPVAARAIAVASILGWLAVIACAVAMR